MKASFYALWAKSSKEGRAGHPVIAHLLDVAASTWALLEREPESTHELYATDLNLPLKQALKWVHALASLHDLGKISPAFQQKWPEGWKHLLEVEPAFDWKHTSSRKAPTPPPKDVSHSAISQATLPDLLEGAGFERRVVSSVADAVGCHHGFRADALTLENARNGFERGRGLWDEARADLFAAVLETLKVESVPQIKTFGAAAWMRLAGLTSFADWVGSSFYPELTFEGFEHDLGGYFERAKTLACARLDTYGWTKRKVLSPERPPLEAVFAYLVPDGAFVPRTLQTEVQALLEEVSGPTLLLIEAAMGEGKTEAALYAHLRLQAGCEHRGLYIALPTMATGNAMYARTAAFLEAQAGDREVSLDLQLLHGATQLNALYQRLQGKASALLEPQPNTPENLQNPDEHFEHVEARTYFSAKKRALLSEYGVGTVDQALLATLNIKHQFVRMWGLGNRTVVIDEVHAYDTYTSSLVVTLVRWLHALGSSVVLMSATLPKKARLELLEAYGAESVPDTDKYPRIFKVSGGQCSMRSFKGEKSREVTLTLEGIPADLEGIVALLEQQLTGGGCAVVICNTVDRAQQLFQKLEGKGMERTLFHARFPAEDRARREAEVLSKFGKASTLENGKRPFKAVCIATQVVEQSLDLDFDLMVSDLAPADLLLQRAGRLWRHERGNRPLGTPVLYLAGMQHSTELPDLSSEYWDTVYSPYILFKTWEALRSRNTLTLPSDIDPLVQRVYDGTQVALELSDSARVEMVQALELWDKQNLEDRKDSDNAAISHVSGRTGELVLRDALKAQEEDDPTNGRPVALTRKGDASVTVVPLYRLGGRYFLDAAGERPYDLKKPLEVYLRSVRLSRKGVVGDPKKGFHSPLEGHNRREGITQVFKGWEKDPLLRNCVPFLLDASGGVVLGTTEVRLEPALGIVYRKTS